MILAFAKIAVLATLALLIRALAAAPTVDLSPILNVLIQIGGLILLGLASWGAQRLATFLHVSTQSTLFQTVLDAVDRGIAYGQQVVTDKAGLVGKVAVQNALQAAAVDYVVAETPAALAGLGLTPQHVANLVLAKLPAPAAPAKTA